MMDKDHWANFAKDDYIRAPGSDWTRYVVVGSIAMGAIGLAVGFVLALWLTGAL